MPIFKKLLIHILPVSRGSMPPLAPQTHPSILPSVILGTSRFKVLIKRLSTNPLVNFFCIVCIRSDPETTMKPPESSLTSCSGRESNTPTRRTFTPHTLLGGLSQDEPCKQLLELPSPDVKRRQLHQTNTALSGIFTGISGSEHRLDICCFLSLGCTPQQACFSASAPRAKRPKEIMSLRYRSLPAIGWLRNASIGAPAILRNILRCSLPSTDNVGPGHTR